MIKSNNANHASLLPAGLVVISLSASMFATAVSAAPIDCALTPGAIISIGIGPTACASGQAGAGAGNELIFVNTEFPDTFTAIGKFDADNGIEDQGADFALTVGAGADGYGYSFALASPTYVDYTIDFALFIKQAAAQTADYAYYWSGAVLNLNGFFNSFNTNGGNAYSHISGFVRIGSPPPPPPPPPPDQRVPEPMTAMLLGLGLLGVGFARRRNRA